MKVGAEILKASEQYCGADPVRDGCIDRERKRAETLVSYDIQTLQPLVLLCHEARPAVKLALKYKPRPKIAEGFIPRTLDARVDARLSALLEAREAEGSLARALFTPDAPASGPLIQTVTPVNNLSRSVSLRQRHDSISGTGKSAADNKASGSGTFRQNNGAFRPAGHDRTVDQTKSSRSGALPQQHPLPVPLQQLQAGHNRNWRSSQRNRDRTCCRPA
jgi:hypothetical protein